MKKVLAVLAAALLLTAGALPVGAQDMTGTGDNVADLINSMETYFTDYLPGVPAASKEAVKEYARQGLTADESKYFMPMMSTLAYLRKAGQAGEKEKIKDVVGDYDKLSETAKAEAVGNLSSALKAIFLKTDFKNGVLTVSADTGKLTEIQFKSSASGGSSSAAPAAGSASSKSAAASSKSTAVSSSVSSAAPADNTGGAPNQGMIDAASADGPAPDVTKNYFNAYLPGISEEYIEKTKALIKVYSQNGGGPAGSGALWRCIREAGILMGREVDMSADYKTFTVTKEGETEFLKLSADIQAQVIEKVKEGMLAIAITATYKDGTFTFTKLGEEQFSYTVKGAAAPKKTAVTKQADEKSEEKTSSTLLIIGISAAVLVAAGGVLFAVKKFSGKKDEQ